MGIFSYVADSLIVVAGLWWSIAACIQARKEIYNATRLVNGTCPSGYCSQVYICLCCWGVAMEPKRVELYRSTMAYRLVAHSPIYRLLMWLYRPRV